MIFGRNHAHLCINVRDIVLLSTSILTPKVDRSEDDVGDDNSPSDLGVDVGVKVVLV